MGASTKSLRFNPSQFGAILCPAKGQGVKTMTKLRQRVVTRISIPTYEIDPEDQYQIERVESLFITRVMALNTLEAIDESFLKNLMMLGQTNESGSFARGYIKFFTSDGRLVKAIDVSSFSDEMRFDKPPIDMPIDEASSAKYATLSKSYLERAREAGLNDSYVTSNEYYDESHFFSQLSKAGEIYNSLVPTLLGNLPTVFSLVKDSLPLECEEDYTWFNEGDILAQMIDDAKEMFSPTNNHFTVSH